MKNLNRRLFLKTAGMLAGASVISETGKQFQTPEPPVKPVIDGTNEKPDEYYISSGYHVATNGNDSNPGTQTAPFRTIQRAADLAQPGYIITVHEGVYRERINPPRGGESDTKRIVYQAAPGERVVIKGSEVIKDWVHVQDDLWKVVLSNTFFGCDNPYRELIRGGWFVSKGREHHTGAVYLNGHWLDEASGIDKMFDPPDANPLWFAHVDRRNTTIFAHFRGVNPNMQTVEINVRWAVFYPEKPHCNYITVRGFTMQQAATQWAPPRAEQVGLIGTHWSKGWIIEDNFISHSRCCGVSLGKYGDEWDNNGRPLEDGTETVGGGTFNMTNCDLFVEVSHGPNLIDNNLFLSDRSLNDNSQGGAYVHNLFAGRIVSRPDERITSYHAAHSTAIAGCSDIKGGDNRFYNNIFIGAEEQDPGLSVYDKRELPLQTGGNVHIGGSKPYSKELNPLVLADADPVIEMVG